MEALKLLIDHGVDVNQTLSCFYPNVRAVANYMGEPYKMRARIESINDDGTCNLRYGDDALFITFVATEANVSRELIDCHDVTPLIISSINGCVSTVSTLLTAGANANFQVKVCIHDN